MTASMTASTTAMNTTAQAASRAVSRRTAARRRAAERRRPRLSRLLAWLLSAVLGGTTLAHAQVPGGALPTGGKVVVGSGQLQQSGKLLVVQQATSKLGLDWQSFNIGSGATVEFRQPGADSVALNRVLGNSGSQIFGQLRANGQVFLTNPNGVLFAPGAKVDVGGLVASTLDLSQEDFAAGRYTFVGNSTASVVNQGSLRASAGGYLALFGKHVSNEGDITVDAGSVLLASGSAATVSISGSGLISAVLTPGAAGAVANSGSIAADGGVVRLSTQSAQDIAASLVNNSGVIRANTLQERQGEIWITGDDAANSGSLSASSGGSADAGRIVLQGGMQHGSVAVGGTLAATSAGGRGGSVETSAAQVRVGADTRVDTRSGGGPHGNWTIDPTDFTVSAGSGSSTTSGIGASTLSTNLGSTNVTLATAPGGSEAGDIHVNADVSWSAGTTLTLQAAHDININAHINASGDSAGLVLTPDGAQGGGSYKLGSGGRITLSGASPTLQIGAVNYTVIGTLDALQAIDTSGLTGNFALGIDLDASSTATADGGLGFNPIGGATVSTGTAFRGRFEGLGHTISGLVINRASDTLAGLFSQLHNASVANLYLTGGSVLGGAYVGGLAAHVTGSSQLLNVHSAQAVTAAPASASTTAVAGGLLGSYQVNAGGAAITLSSASGNVTSTSNVGYLGGLVGYQSAGGISDSSASGDLSLPLAATAYRLGGLVGQFNGSGSLLRVSATGAVPGNSDYAGGLVGEFTATGGIANASASGAVSGRHNVGGLVGSASGNTADVSSVSASGAVSATGSNVGGLFGELGGSGSISQAHATGNVAAGGNSVGGLVGSFSRSGTADHLSAGGHVSGTNNLGGLVGHYSGSASLGSSSATGSVAGNDYVGGLLGRWSSSGALDTVNASGAVTGADYVGGLVGYAEGNNAGITAGRATGNVTATGTYVGGLLGRWYSYSAAAAAGIVDSQATGHVTGNNAVGGLVGSAYGYYYDGTNAYIDNSSASGNVRSNGSAGGLVGELEYTSLSRSSASGNVTSVSNSTVYAGGLVGRFTGTTDDTISNSSATGAVFVDSNNAYAGGLVGYFSGSEGVSLSTASGSVTVIDSVNGNYNNGYAGGLVGSFSGSRIDHSAASGNVQGAQITGGLVGQYYGTAALDNVSASGRVQGGTYAGGLVGHLARGGIEAGFASGDVTGNVSGASAGGLVGYSDAGYYNNASNVINDSTATGNVSGGSYAGGLVGYWYGYYYDSTASNGITNARASGDVSSDAYAGGLVGYFVDYQSDAGALGIRNSVASGHVQGVTFVGGLAGYANSYGGLHDNRATGNVTSLAGRSDTYLGGLVGQYVAQGTAGFEGNISGSMASGNVTLAGTSAMISSTDVWAGGLLGMLQHSGTLTRAALSDSYSSGQVSASHPVGRLRVGGLIGQSNSNIARTYATGAVQSTGGTTRAVGGLVGAVASSAAASSSYWATDSTGQASSVLGTAKTLAELKSAATYSDWSLADAGGSTDKTWRIYEGQATPLLRGFLTPVSLSLADLSKTYDGTTSLGNAVVGNGVAHPERILVGGISTHVGSYALSPGALYSTQDGYDLSITGSATLTVQPKALTLDGFAASKVYDRSTTATINGSGQPGGLVAGDDLTFQPDSSNFSLQFDSRNVGTRTVTLSGSYTWADGSNGKVADYTLPVGNTTTAEIAPALLTAGSFTASNRAYDGTTTVAVAASSATLQGVIGGDSVSVDLSSVSSGTLASREVGTGKTVSVQGVQVTGADAGNYRVAGVDSVTVDITPKALTANGFTVSDKTYNSNTSVGLYTTGATLNGVVGSDIVLLRDSYVTGNTADKNVGSNLPVSLSGLTLRGPDAANYSVQASNVTVNVLPRNLYVYSNRTSETDRTYDGTTDATLNVYLSNQFNSDDLVLAWTGISFADKNVARNSAGNVISKTITVSGITVTGADAGNYALQNTSTTNSGTIRPVDLVVRGITTTNRVYDGTRDVAVNVASATVDTSTVVPNDDVQVSIPSTGTVTGTLTDKNAGTDKPVTVPGLTLTGSAAGNYSLNSGTAGVTVDIARKDVSVSYTASDRVYNGSTGQVITSATASGVVQGDDISFQSDYYRNYYYGYNPWASFADKNVGTGKVVTISNDALMGNDAANYALINPAGTTTTASISAKPVTLAFSGVNKVYDGTTAASVNLNRSASGLVSNDVLTVAASASFTGIGAKNVGTGKAVEVTGISLSGTDAGNYTVANTSANTTASITAKPVTLTGISATPRAYNGSLSVAVSASNVTSTGFIDGDLVSVADTSGVTSGLMASKGVGTDKPVQVTGLTLQGADKDNYSIDLAGSDITVDITPKPLTASYTGVDRVYNGGVSVNVVGSSADIVANDVVTFSQSAIFSGGDGRNVGTAKPVAVSNITLGGGDAANYSLTADTASTTASITAKAVTPIYSGVDRVYNGVADTSVSVLGSSLQLIAGDQVSFTQTAAFSGDGSAGLNKPVAVSGITLTGADAGNYSLAATSLTTSATITQRPLGITGITAANRVYDGTTTVNVNVLNATVDTSNVVAADIGQVAVSLPSGGITTGDMADRHVGVGKAVSVTGLDISGAAASNYQVVGASGLTVNISPLALTATYTGVDKVYDGTTAAQLLVTAPGLLGVDAGSVGFNAPASFTGIGARNVGSNKSVAVTGAFLTGANRENYTLANPDGSTTASITQRDLVASFSGGTRVYDGSVAAPVTAHLANAINGDTLGTEQTAEFTGAGAKNVGSGKAIAVSGITLTGADAGNYRLGNTSASSSGSVTAKPITINGLTGVTAIDRVYDGTADVIVNVPANVTLSPNSSDIVLGDDVQVAVPAGGLTSGLMADKHVGDGKVVTVSGLTLDGGDKDNYRIQGTAGITVNISPLALTASYTGIHRVYDGSVNATVSGTSGGILGGDSVSITGSGVFTGSGAKNVGTGKAIDVLSAQLGSTDARNYTLINPTGTASADILVKAVTAAYTSPGKVYDGSTSAPVQAGRNGFVAGDQVGLAQNAVFTDGRNVGDNKSISVSGITLTGADAINYALTATTAFTSGTITARPLGINGLQGVTASNRSYDGTTRVEVMVNATGPITPNEADIVSGDVVGVSTLSAGATTGTLQDKNVGTAKPVMVDGLALTGADAGNYVITATTGVTVDISPRAISAVYAGVDRVYDGSVAATVTGSSSGVLGGDSLSIAGTGVFSGAGARNVGTAKPIDVQQAQLAGTDAFNYMLSNPTGTATGSITPKTLSASYTGGTRVYDGNVAAPVSGSASGLVDGDSVTLAQDASFTGLGARNVGSGKAVSVSGITLGGTDAGNYVLASTSADTTASITPRPLGVDGLTGVTAASRAYDGTRQVEVLITSTGPIEPSQADVIDGDDVTVTAPGAGQTTGTMADKNVGTAKAVVVAGLTLGGADADNYRIASTTGVTVDITPRVLSAVYTGVDKVYDGSVAATATGAAGGVVGGDNLLITGTGVFSGTGARNAGSGKTVLVQAASLSGTDAGNYSLANPTGSTTASITPRPLTASYTGGSKVYDGSTTAPVVAGSNDAISGDDLGYSANAVFTGAGARNVGSGKDVLVSGITLTGTDATNYSLVNASASTTASVTPRPLSISNLTGVAALDRVYDGTSDVQVSVTGPINVPTADVISGDLVTVHVPSGGPSGGTMADKHAGPNKAVVLSGLTLEGADAGNYQITGTAGVTVNIAPRPVTLLGVSAQDRVYDGSTVVAINTGSGSILGTLAGDDLQLLASGVSGSMADKNAGTAKPVAVAGLALGGADAANYTVADSALSVNIARRSLVPGLSAVGKVYNGDTGASITLLDNRVAGDALTLAAASAGFADKNAGVDKPVTASGLALAGSDAANYELSTTSVATTASITPAPATVTAASLSKVYGETISFTGSEFTTTGLVAGETIGRVTLASSGAAAGQGVGASPYALTASDARGGSFSLSNYLLSYQAGQLTVTPRPLNVAGRIVVRYADQPNPARFDYTLNEGGLVNGDAISGLTLEAPGGSDTASGGSIYELVPSNAVFGPGSNANYDVRYLNGLLIVLPTPPRIADADTGGGDSGGGLGVVVDPAELAQAADALERARTQTSPVAAPPPAPGLSAAAGAPGSDTAAAAAPPELGLLLAGDGRRITLPGLLRLPLLSLDPQLQRLIQGNNPAPATQSTPATTP